MFASGPVNNGKMISGVEWGERERVCKGVSEGDSGVLG